MRRVKLTKDVTTGFGSVRKRGATGTVVEDYGSLLKIHWDEGLETFVDKRYVEDVTVLDDIINGLV